MYSYVTLLKEVYLPIVKRIMQHVPQCREKQPLNPYKYLETKGKAYVDKSVKTRGTSPNHPLWTEATYYVDISPRFSTVILIKQPHTYLKAPNCG